MKTHIPGFKSAQQSFERLLLSHEKDLSADELEVFMNSIRSIEAFTPEEIRKGCLAYRRLFIEIFQFSVMIENQVWAEVPTLHKQVGSVINSCADYEKRFRSKVTMKGYGKSLKFIQ